VIGGRRTADGEATSTAPVIGERRTADGEATSVPLIPSPSRERVRVRG